MDRANVVYPNDPECLAGTFDVRQLEATPLHRQRAVLAGNSNLEVPIENSLALVVWPGRASELAA